MRRDLLRRLAKLEERRPNPLPLLRTVCITDFIEEPRRKTLAPGERIVLDWYSDVNFEVLARERITSDPCDQGHRCEPIPPLPRGYTEREAPIIVAVPALDLCAIRSEEPFAPDRVSPVREGRQSVEPAAGTEQGEPEHVCGISLRDHHGPEKKLGTPHRAAGAVLGKDRDAEGHRNVRSD